MSTYPPPVRRSQRLGVGAASLGIGVLLAGMWLLEGVDQASGNALDQLGIDELGDYVRALRAEIRRAEATMELKRGQRAAAETFFRPK